MDGAVFAVGNLLEILKERRRDTRPYQLRQVVGSYVGEAVVIRYVVQCQSGALNRLKYGKESDRGRHLSEARCGAEAT